MIIFLFKKCLVVYHMFTMILQIEQRLIVNLRNASLLVTMTMSLSIIYGMTRIKKKSLRARM